MRNPLAGLGPRQPAQEEAGGLDWGRAARAIFPDQPPEIVDRDFAEELQAGKPPEAVIAKGAENALKELPMKHSQRVQQIYASEQDAQKRATAKAEEDKRAALKWKLLGGVGQILQRKDPTEFVAYFDELSNAEKKEAFLQAREQRNAQLGQLDAERIDAQDAQQQEEREAASRTGSEAGELVSIVARDAGLNIPEGMSPEAILKVAPFLREEIARRSKAEGGGLEEFEAKERIRAQYRAQPGGFDEESYRRKKEIDRELAPVRRGNFNPSDQVGLVQKASKEDAAARTILTSLDRALEAADGGAKDISYLYNFIARMDNTAAREGELQLAQRAQNIADRLKTFISNKTEGELIGPGLRGEIAEILRTTRDQVQEERQLIIGNYRNVAGDLGGEASVLQSLDSLLEYGEGSTVPGSAVDQPAQGKIRVTDGRETLEIDEADLQEAEADGFRRM